MPTAPVPPYPSSQDPFVNPYFSAPPPPAAYFEENAPLIRNNPRQIQNPPAYSKSPDKYRNAKSFMKIMCGITCMVGPLLVLIAAFTMSTVSLTKIGSMSSFFSKNFVSCVDCDQNVKLVPGALNGLMAVSRARDSLYKGFGVSLVPRVSSQQASSYFPAPNENLGTAILPFDDTRFVYAVVTPQQTIQARVFGYDSFGFYYSLQSTQLPCKNNMQLLKGVALKPDQNGQRNFGFIVKCDTNYYYTQVFAEATKLSQYSAITLSGAQVNDPQALDLIAMDHQTIGFAFTNTAASYNNVIFGVCGSEGDWFRGCTTANAVSQRLACSKPATVFRAPDVVDDSRSWLSMGVVCDSQAKTFVFRPTTMTGVEELKTVYLPTQSSQTSRFHNFETPAYNTTMLHTYVYTGGVLKARLLNSLSDYDSGSTPAEVIIDKIDPTATQPTHFDYQFLETERASFFVYTKGGQRVIKVVSFNDFKPDRSGTTSGIVIRKQTLDTSAFAKLTGVQVLATNTKGVFVFGTSLSPQGGTLVTSGIYQIFGAPSLYGIAQRQMTWRVYSPYTTYFGGVIKAPGMFTEGQRFKVRNTGEVLPVDADSEPGVPEYFIGVAISKDELLLQLSFEEL